VIGNRENGPDPEPLVSIVTPFHDSVPYLEECVQSVLAQTYVNFEYVLVDNASTDDGGEIAARYADKDARIRFVETPKFLSQADNYNFALSLIDPASDYVKMVQADDAIYPTCVAEMVAVARATPSIGLVSSYYLVGDRVFGDGVARSASVIPGVQVCRQMLSLGYPLRRVDAARSWITGSATTVMYRADIVRSRVPFFENRTYFNDTFAAFDILLDHDLGFVHQVLSWTRDDNPSISSAVWDFEPDLVQSVLLLARYGERVLSASELAEHSRAVRWAYYRLLARRALSLTRGRFWTFHRDQLASVDLRVRRCRLAGQTVLELGAQMAHPLRNVARARRARRRTAVTEHERRAMYLPVEGRPAVSDADA
jgi:glycosyltransferase involved in cell wall biosynthesis